MSKGQQLMSFLVRRGVHRIDSKQKICPHVTKVIGSILTTRLFFSLKFRREKPRTPSNHPPPREENTRRYIPLSIAILTNKTGCFPHPKILRFQPWGDRGSPSRVLKKKLSFLNTWTRINPLIPEKQNPTSNNAECHIVITSVAGRLLLLCLWVQSRITGRHVRSGHRSLRNPREMLEPTTLSLSSLCFPLPQHHRAEMVL